VERRGKYLLLRFDGEAGVLAHLGMTGKLLLRNAGEPAPYSRARWELESGEVVHLCDMRKFGRLALAGDLPAMPEIAALGPDAMDPRLSGALLEERLGRTKRPVKIALMDQTAIAGLGNIHAAESLFRAKIDPRRGSDRLTRADLERLARAIQDDLAYALQVQPRGPSGDVEYVEEPGTPNPFLVYGKAGERCPRCGAPLRSFVQGGRTTYACLSCQR
jgi:formamidopyrimidine-DNA glycosylase